MLFPTLISLELGLCELSREHFTFKSLRAGCLSLLTCGEAPSPPLPSSSFQQNGLWANLPVTKSHSTKELHQHLQPRSSQNHLLCLRAEGSILLIAEEGEEQETEGLANSWNSTEDIVKAALYDGPHGQCHHHFVDDNPKAYIISPELLG